MGTEIAGPIFGPIVLIVATALVVVTIKGWRRPISETSTLGLGRSRIASGYLGALLACVPLGIWMARDDVRFRVERHYITAEDAARYQLGWSFELFFITAMFTLVLVTAVGLPILMLLRKIGLASIAGTLGAGLVIALLFSWLAHASFAETEENIAILLVVAVGFGLPARLPLIKSPKSQSINRD